MSKFTFGYDADYDHDEYGEERVHGVPHKVKLKRWEVVDKDGNAHLVEAHYAFNNGEEGLVFRCRVKPSDEYTSVVAAWGHGFWAFCKEIRNVE